MLETKKKVFAITNSWSGNFVSRHISKPPCTTAQGRQKRGAGGRTPIIVWQISTNRGEGRQCPPTYYLPPPDFQTFQNPCCSVLVAFLAPSYPFLLKVIGNKRFYIFRLLNKPNELMYFARNPPWHVFWQVSSSAPKNICY